MLFVCFQPVPPDLQMIIPFLLTPGSLSLQFQVNAGSR
jgi:hypothetical protein